MPSPSTTETDVLTALRTFLLAVLPAGVEVIAGQDNRVPEPSASDYVVMTPTRRVRLATNVDGSGDVKFTGSIAGSVMTVSAVAYGSISPGATVFGVGVAIATIILSQASGIPGGIGTYNVSNSQTIASETLSSGASDLLQSTEVVVQLDVHGMNSTDNAQVITTTMRDSYAVDFFAGVTPNKGVVPLYPEDPVQTPFINENNQYEDRWTIYAHLEIDPTVSIPLQYADTVEVDLINVEATYPP